MTKAGIMGCKVEQLPFNYLGLPLGAEKNDNKMWQGVLDKCNNKLVPWKRQYLSFGERLAFVNSGLDGIPTYLMSHLRMPTKIEKKLNSMRNNFFWEVNADKGKFHLVKWQEMMKEKKNGGLGMRNLKLHNKFGDTIMEIKAYGQVIDANYGKRDS